MKRRLEVPVRMALLALLALAVGCGGGKKSRGDGDEDVTDEDAEEEGAADAPDAEDVAGEGDVEEDVDVDLVVDVEEEADAVADPVADPVTDPVTDPATEAEEPGEDPAEDGVDDLVDDDAEDVTTDGTPCVDPVVDGRFLGMTTWTTTGAAIVNPTAVGYLEAGEGELPPASVCDLDTISQSFTLPSQTDCGPARLDLWLNAMTFVGGLGTAFTSNVSGNYQHYQEGFLMGWTQVSNCLGEAAHTGAASVALGAAFPPIECDTSPSLAQGLRVDNVTVEYDPACPYIGEVTNGDLEAGTGIGWGTRVTSGATAVADAPGVGISGSYAARIQLTAGCQEAVLWVPMSVPLTSTMASPALSFQANLSTGENARFRVGNHPTVEMTGTGSYEEVLRCLPRHLAGGVYDVTWQAVYTGTCSVPVGPLNLYIDDVRVINDSACVFASGLLDPGFESSTADAQRYGWITYTNPMSYGGSPVAEIVSDTSRSRSGIGSAHMSVNQKCDSASIKQAIEVPSPTSSEGPAVVFWYRYPSPTFSVLQMRVSAFHEWGKPLSETTGTMASTYTRQVMCLPPGMAGRPAILGITLSSSGLCADFFTAEEAWFDDFEVTTDSSCPSS